MRSCGDPQPPPRAAPPAPPSSPSTARANNARHHAAQRGQRLASGWLDPASSAAWFDGWHKPRALDCSAYWIAQLLRYPRPTHAPQTWLCNTGWRHHGLLHPDDTPGPAHAT